MHLWTTAAGLLIGIISSLILDSMPSKYAVAVPDSRYALLEGAALVGSTLVATALFVWLWALWRDRSTGSIYVIYLLLGVLGFAVGHMGFDIYARTLVGGESLLSSVAEVIHDTASAPVGSSLLMAPFLFLAWISARLAKAGKLVAGIVLFATGIVILCYLYYSGHMDAQTSLLAKRWTAASLSIGFLPLKSAVLLAVWYVVALNLMRENKINDT